MLRSGSPLMNSSFSVRVRRSVVVASDRRLAAALEAIIGAVYLAHGFEAAKRFVLTHLEPEIAAPRAAIGKGIKTMLQEWTQARNGSLPRYDIISTSGPEHERIYECAVRIDGERLRGEWPQSARCRGGGGRGGN